MKNQNKGIVYLVGAGPGDSELMTLKAVQLLRNAEVVVYDRLVGKQILEFIAPEAEVIFVGKSQGCHTVPQPDINAILVEKAQLGKTVVRLKGGDPFIFGRGGEEALECQKAGIPFEVVPGVTSATAVGAYAGIPLTHRGLSSSVTLITGHLRSGELPNVPWECLAKTNHTVVFYMGLSTLPLITQQLMAHGCSSDLPVAVIQEGTLPQQRAVVGNLQTIIDLVETHKLRSPSLIIIGEVVRLRESLQWFETKVSFADFQSPTALNSLTSNALF